MSSTARQRRYQFQLTGGALCLDFANTVDYRSGQERRLDHLTTCEDLISFNRQAGVIKSREAIELYRISANQPAAAQWILQRALALREAIYAIFSAVAARRQPLDADLELLNANLADALQHLRVNRVPDGYALRWSFGKGTLLDQLLWPMARSAAELLTSDLLKTVRECAAESCDWLFLDNSRSQSRRWCDMKVCGNREKARRFLRRNKARKNL
jgi:predicted RNA-binding Zn ribbon-like protein